MVVWADEIADGEQRTHESAPLTVTATLVVSVETVIMSGGIPSGGGSADHATSDSRSADAGLASALAGN